MDSDYCLLLALPCGRDQEDVLNQTHALKGGFITYLQAKLAAGIINVPNPGSNQVCFTAAGVGGSEMGVKWETLEEMLRVSSIGNGSGRAIWQHPLRQVRT